MTSKKTPAEKQTAASQPAEKKTAASQPRENTPPWLTSPSEAKAKRSHKAKDKKSADLPFSLGMSEMPPPPHVVSDLFANAMKGVMDSINVSVEAVSKLEMHRREQQSAQRQREHEFHLAALKAVAEASRR